MVRCLLLITLSGVVFTLSVGSMAQPAPSSNDEEQIPDRTIKVTGVLQHVAGDVVRSREIPPSPPSPIVALEPIYEGQGYVLGPQSIVKIATRELCTLVVYGPGRIRTRERDGRSEWSMNARAWRSICPDGTSAHLAENRAPITSQGELVVGPSVTAHDSLDNERWYFAKRGHQALGSIELRSGEVGLRKGNTWVRRDPELHPYTLFLFDHSLPRPSESTPLPLPKRPLSTRLLFSPGFGRGFAFFDNPQLTVAPTGAGSINLSIYNQIPAENAFWPNGTFVTSLSLSGLDSSSRTDSSTAPDEYSESSLVSIEAGGRLFQTWLSPFFRFGFGYESARISVHRPDLNLFSASRYEFYQLTAAAGIDGMITPFRRFPWVGLYGGVEWRAETTLFRGGRYLEFENGVADPEPEGLREPRRLSKLMALARMGLMFQF